MTKASRATSRRPILALALALGGLAAGGCGGGSGPGAPADEVRSGPHGGPVVPLPGEKGFAEVLSEPAKGKKASLDARVVVYFLGPDLKAPLDGPPSGVTVSLRTPDAPEPLAFPLAPDPKGGGPGKDSLAAGRFASAVGPTPSTGS